MPVLPFRKALPALAAVGALLTGWAVGTTFPASAADSPSADPEPTAAAPELRVSGNQLVTASGDPHRLLGVNRSGGEFGCVQNKEIFDGPTDQAAVDAMLTWNINTVRLPLNEECWLGTENLPSTAPSAAEYQQAVEDYVNLLVANGLNVILDLHWSYGQ